MNSQLSFKSVGVILLGLLLTILVHAHASATVVDLNFVAAATATDVGPQDGVFDAFAPLNFGSVNNNGFTSFRTALEFDISAVPAGSTVNAATLTMFANVDQGPREIALYGYAGDGSISLDDFSLGGLVAQTTMNPVAGLQTVLFDGTTFLDSLVATGEAFAGFNVREDPANPVNFGVMGFMELPARLSIDFTARAVPAPPGIWLFGSGVLGLLWIKSLRRRRRGRESTRRCLMRRMSSLVAALVVLCLPMLASADPIIDTLGSATPTTQFPGPGSGGPGILPDQLIGPRFSLTEATVLTEIGAFIANDPPAGFAVQVRPSTNGLPDPSTFLASFVLPTDNSPLISYEATQIDLTLGAGTYFALFAPTGSVGGSLLGNALFPDGSRYFAGSTPLGVVRPATGDVFLDEVPAAVRILGEPARAVPAPPGVWLFSSGVLGLLRVKRLRRRRPVLDQNLEEGGCAKRRGHQARLALGLALILFLPPAAEASVINGGFESGDFSGWQTVGNDFVTTSTIGVAPTEGTHQALLNTNFGVASPASASQIEMFLDLPSGTLSNMAAIDGGAIKQTITAAAHDVLSFSWDFATNEGIPGSNNTDFAFVSLAQLSVLADPSSGLVPYPQNPPFIFHTGYRSFSFAIPVSGDYLLGIGVVNAGISRGNSSGLLVDDIALAAVPQPPSVWLFLVGCLPLLARWRMFR